MKYTVHMAVDGRIDLEVEAESPEAAYGEVVSAFEVADLSRLEVIDAKPVHCENDEGEIVKEY
jgi:hypothetical protein